jgi:DNA segregation ATPase FtsK/SpoIIIE-like protein
MQVVGEELIARATAVLVERQEVSISLLQRTLALGYRQALAVMSALADKGVVTAADENGRRQLSTSYRRS